MPLRYIRNESGLTLAELVISLGLTSLLLALVVGGSLFVERFVADWSNRDKITEELAFICDEIVPRIESARHIASEADTLVFKKQEGHDQKYWLEDGELIRDGRPLTRAGLHVDLLELDPYLLQNRSSQDTLSLSAGASALYRLTVAVSDNHGNRDTLVVAGKNSHETLKNQ